MMSVTVRIEDGVGWVRLNRPGTGNAINLALADDLFSALSEAKHNQDVRCIVLAAEGKLFCGGGDVVAFGAEGEDSMPEQVRMLADNLHRSIELIEGMEKPFITSVQGTAAGAGVVLGAMGDIVLASDRAKFVAAYGSIGLTPDGGSTWVLPRVMGERRAMEFLLLNKTMGADDAVACGLVTRVVPHEELEPETVRLAMAVAEGSGWAFGKTRRLVRDGRNAPLHEQLDHEADTISRSIGRSEARAAVSAFLKSR